MKIKVKNKWTEITLAELIEIGDIDQDESLEGLPINKRIHHIEVISNATVQELEKLNGEDLGRVMKAAEFLDTEPKKTRAKTFKIGGVEFMFHPKLHLLTAGEMISIETVLKRANDTKVNPFPDLLSILIRPVEIKERGEKTEKYIADFKAEEMAERKELFLNKLMVPNYYHEINFFLASDKTSKNKTP
jgi:hypothetical protein